MSKRNRHIAIATVLALGLIVSIGVEAATSSQTSSGATDLYYGSSRLASHSNLAACEAGARSAANSAKASGQYTCRTSWTVTVTYTPDAPVNCAVSAWGPETSSSVTNPDGSRTITYSRSRTVVTQPANGGTPCPPLTEVIRTETVPAPSGGQISGSYEPGPLTVNLSGASAVARWPGYVSSAIGNVSGGTQYSNDPRVVNGSRMGLYNAGGQFTFNVNGTNSRQLLKVYVGGWNSGARLSVAQGGQTLFTGTRPVTAGQWNAVYTISFTGQITVSWAQNGGGGNVTIQAAALYPGPGGTVPPVTGNAHLSWTAPSQNTDGSPLADLAGFYVYRGNSPDSLVRHAEIWGATQLNYDDPGLPAGTWFYAVSAFNARGVESARSGTGYKTIQ